MATGVASDAPPYRKRSAEAKEYPMVMTRDPNYVRRSNEAYIAQTAEEKETNGGCLLVLLLALPARGGLWMRRRI